MIVTKDNLRATIELLMKESFLSIDTETTGLDHTDRLFSIIIGGANDQYYFNFNTNYDIPVECRLNIIEGHELHPLFARRDVVWFLHNASFDLDMLERSGFVLNGDIHCTMTIAKIQNNSHLSYALDSVSQRAGFPPKDDRVKAYLDKNKLYTKGTNKRKRYHFDKVPFELITEYACMDADLTRRLGLSQLGNGGIT